MRAWLTPDDPPSGVVYISLAVPRGEDFEAMVRGALVPLTDPANFELFGALTPEQTAGYFQSIQYQWWSWEGSMYVGQIVWLAGQVTDTHLLPCDGREISQSEYAELYTIVGDVWGTAGAGMFCIPDLRSRSIVGAGAGTGLTERIVGENGGLEVVSLDVDHIPNHDHTVHSHATALVVSPGEITVSVPSGGSGSTGAVGGGQAHENMHPFAVLIPYIVAR